MTRRGIFVGRRSGGAARRAVAGVAALALTLVALRAFLLLPERCDRPTVSELDAAAGEAVAWFERNQRPSGRFTYEFDVEAGEDRGGYNFVRHAGVLMSLYQAAAAGWEDALPVADRGLQMALRSLVSHDDWSAFGTRGTVLRTGATALLAVALTLRQDATGDDRHEALLGALGRFLLAVQGSDGRIHALWDPETGAPVPDEFSPFFTGETMWALTRLHGVFPGEGWDEAALRTARYVIERRDEEEDWFPPLSDHWAAYAVAEMKGAAWSGVDLRLDDEGRDWVRRQAGLFGVQVRFESQRTGEGWIGLVRGGTARGGGVGTIGEGLAGLRVVARDDPRLAGLRDAIDERLLCVNDLLAGRQVDSSEAARMASPEVAQGAWLHDGSTRMDDQQHALSSLLLMRRIVAGSREEAP